MIVMFAGLNAAVVTPVRYWLEAVILTTGRLLGSVESVAEVTRVG